MSHVTVTPQTPTGSESEEAHLRVPDVRKMLEAYAEREVQRVRWSAVMAGLFLSLGSHILLGCLGSALGLTARASSSQGPLSNFGSSACLWTVFVSLFSTFIGGFAAAKLGGAIRRGDGVLSGILTWATSLVLSLFMVLPTLNVHTAATGTSAWFVFGGALFSLLSAMLGGAAGSVGGGSMRGDRGARKAQRLEIQKRTAEIEVELEQLRREDEQRS
jgi:hypothetical protein